MKNYNITLLKGDGIGPEIVNEAVTEIPICKCADVNDSYASQTTGE